MEDIGRKTQHRQLCFNVMLDDGAVVSDITRAMRMIRGITSVQEVKQSQQITPALKRRIARAEKNYKEGNTVKFNSVDEMDRYLDTL